MEFVKQLFLIKHTDKTHAAQHPTVNEYSFSNLAYSCSQSP